MTQEEFDKAPLLDQILYDTTGMLVENHPHIAEAMDKYHQAKLKLLGIADVSDSLLKSLHQDLKGFQEMGFLTPDAKSGLGIAIEQVERYMRGDLEARQQ